MATIELTQGLAAEIDDADMPVVGRYKWCAHRIGARCYAATTIDGKTVHMHRLLVGVPEKFVDHRDGDGLNNRRANLRVCTARENTLNSRKRLGGTSRYRGVYAYRGKWSARIVCHGRTYFLGLHPSEKAAALAYNRAARKLFGEFARLNEVAR
jgi:hypothetical protein